jgi:hypothetical protein
MSASTDSFVELGKRNRPARPANSQSLTPGSPGYNTDFPGIDQMIGASSQSSNDSNNVDTDDSTTATPVAKRSKKKKKAGAAAQPELCCSCPPSQSCSLRSNCACLSAGRICVRCDPGTCSKCRNTAFHRQRLQRAAEAKAKAEQDAREKADREADARKKKLLDSIGATPKPKTNASTKQSPSSVNPVNGLDDDANAEASSSVPGTPQSQDTTAESDPSQDDTEDASPPVSTEDTQQHRMGAGDSSASSGDGKSQSAADSMGSQPTAAPTRMELPTRKRNKQLNRSTLGQRMQRDAALRHEHPTMSLQPSREFPRTRARRTPVLLATMQYSMRITDWGRGTPDTE